MRTPAWVAAIALFGCGSGPGSAAHGDAPAARDGAAGGDGATADSSGDAQPAPSGRWVLGYYAGYEVQQLPVADVDWASLTHVAMAPLLVDASGAIDESFDSSTGTGSADAIALATAAHAHGVVPLLMLGGAGDGANIAAVADSAHRAAFVTALLGAVDQLGYDGIDLDWEDSVNLDDLVALAQALRAARPAIVLTYPGGALNGNIDSVDPRMVTLAASLDQFNVQTYFPSTAFAGEGWDSWFLSPLSGAAGATPIAIDDTLARYATAGIPKAKLGMGTAFYAICYTADITGPRQPTSTGTTEIFGGDGLYSLSAFYAAGSTFDTHASARTRDAAASEPYLALATAVIDQAHCGGPTHYISYEDETSLAAKGAFAIANGYGGAIVWTLAQGKLPAGASGGRDANAITSALYHAFRP